MISRLKTSEWGLSPQHLRQLYTSRVTPILDHGAEAWWRGQKGHINKLQKLQNTACRRILGAFQTSPIIPMELETSLPPLEIWLQHTCWKYALRTMTLPEFHLIQLRTSSTFPPEYNSGIEVDPDLKPNWNSEDSGRTHSQLWSIQHIVAEITPYSTPLEQLANPPWYQQIDPTHNSVHISQQKKEEVAEAHISLTNDLVNDPRHLLLYTDGFQRTRRDGSNASGTGLVAIHSGHTHQERRWNLGRHVEVYDTELYGMLQATEYAKRSLTPS